MGGVSTSASVGLAGGPWWGGVPGANWGGVAATLPPSTGFAHREGLTPVGAVSALPEPGELGGLSWCIHQG